MGTPSQLFRSLLAIDFNGLCLFSSDCTSIYCDGRFKYDRNASSTFSRPSTNCSFESAFPEWWTSGPAAKDVLRLNDFEIGDQEFEEATEVRAGILPVPFEGIIGLSRFDYTTSISNLTGMNAFHNMINQKLLSRNVFSLVLPRVRGDVGVLSFGMDDVDMRAQSAMTLPLTGRDHEDHKAHEYLGSGWQTGLSGVHMDAWDGHAAVDFPLDNYTVVFSTTVPLLVFPVSILEALKQALHVGPDEPLVDCEKRCIMPNITLRIGAGTEIYDISLTPWDYTSTSSLVFPDDTCSLPWDGNGAPDEHRLLVLGTPFLRQFHSVFDYDNVTITRKCSTFLSLLARTELTLVSSVKA